MAVAVAVAVPVPVPVSMCLLRRLRIVCDVLSRRVSAPEAVKLLCSLRVLLLC